MSKQTSTKKSDLEPGKLYLLKSDVWAMDYLNPDFVQVYIRDQVFKVKADSLVLTEGKKDEH